MIREYRPELAKFGLTYPQFLVMMSLWNKDNINIKELTSETLFDASTLTAVLKKLSDKGLLECKPSITDKRAKVIILTKLGISLKDKTSHIFKNMECRVELSNQEQQSLIEICHKILSRLS
jgi:DNA-binding MarR family transcriptional regulator